MLAREAQRAGAHAHAIMLHSPIRKREGAATLPTLPESRLSSPREGRERAQDCPADGEDVAAPPER